MTTKCVWSLPTGIRSAVDFEARRRGTTPSRLVVEFFAERFPSWVAEALDRTIWANLDDPQPKPGLAVVPDRPQDNEVT
jgi:hypothetical protein